MKKIMIPLAIFGGMTAYAQTAVSGTAQVKTSAAKEVLEKPYHPKENAEQKLKELSALAKKNGKKILVQAGGNWCIWCLRLNDFIKKDKSLYKEITDKFYIYHLNFSPENKNEKIFAKYGDPGKNGYPVWLILDQNLKLVKTQETASLEDGKSYDAQKIRAALGL